MTDRMKVDLSSLDNTLASTESKQNRLRAGNNVNHRGRSSIVTLFHGFHDCDLMVRPFTQRRQILFRSQDFSQSEMFDTSGRDKSRFKVALRAARVASAESRGVKSQAVWMLLELWPKQTMKSSRSRGNVVSCCRKWLT